MAQGWATGGESEELRWDLNRLLRWFFSNPALSLVFRLLLGGLFIWASLDKIAHPAAFAQAVANYRILPASLLHPVAIILPWLEIIAGSLLILGIFVPGSSLLILVMLAVFDLALASTIIRGIDLSCGCFQTGPSAERVNPLYLARDSSLIIAALQVLLSPRSWATFPPLLRSRTKRT